MQRSTKVFLTAIVFLVWNLAPAQNVSITANTDATQVELNGYFNLEFKIENSIGKQFTAPDLSAFTVLSGPSQSVSTSIINGTISKSSSYSYTLQPRREGRFTIGPASIVDQGKRYASNPITITVSKTISRNSSGQANTAHGKYFVRAEPSQNTVYPGQQILLDYRLYTSTDVSSFRFNNTPEFDGAYAVEVKNYNAASRSISLNGKQYVTKIMARMALFPTATDNITISDVPITLGIPAGEDDPFSTLFGTSSPVPLLVEGTQIKVKPLPVPQPQNFSGGVGKFQYSYTIDKNRITTDDAIRLTFTLSGNGDMKKITLPTFTENDTIEPYDPQIIDNHTEETNNGIVTTQTYTISILAKKTGLLNLQIPAFTYFDPEIAKYKTIRPTGQQIEVTLGHKPPGSNIPQPSNDSPKQNTFVDTYKEWIMGCILALLIVIALLYFSRRNRMKIEPETQLMEKTDNSDIIVPVKISTLNAEPDRRSRDEVTAALQRARVNIDHEDFKEFYRQLHRALAISIASRFNLPFSEFSRQKAWDLTRTGLDTQTASEIDRLLAQLELAIYANQYPATDKSTLLESVIALIERVRVQ